MSDGNVLRLRLSLMGRPVRNYAFDKPVISVGRDPGADVYVDNPGISRDHFRLERTANGEYQMVDLGSANGTFVNDHMVNSSVLHNNDVVRFGKYTLWVGYESNRRSATRDERTAAAAAEPSGHTVVLSRSDIGNILENDNRQATASAAKVVPMPMPDVPRARMPGPLVSWPSLAMGIFLGVALAAGTVWLLLQG